MKKFTFVCTLCLILSLLLNGCKSDKAIRQEQDTNEGTDLGSINIVRPDWVGTLDNPEQNEKVKAEIEKSILEQTGYKLDVNISFYPGGDYFNKISTLLASNKQVDAFVMWYPNGGYINYATKPKLIKPIDELLKDAPDLKSKINADSWRSVTYDGQIMAIPSVVHAQNYSPLIRKDWLDAAGLPVPETLEQLNAVLEQFKKDGKLGFSTQLWQIDRWFCGSLGIPYTDFRDSEGNLWDKFFHPNYITYLDILRDWYEKGYVPKDFLSARWQDAEDMFKSGQMGICITYYGNIPDFVYQMKQVDPNAEVVNLPMFDAGVAEPGVAVENTTTDVTFILEKSQNPKGVIAYYEWLISKPENYILANSGIDGENVIVDSAKKTTMVTEKYEDGNMKNYPGTYGMLDWNGIFSDWRPDSRNEFKKQGIDLQVKTMDYLNSLEKYVSPTSGYNYELSPEMLTVQIKAFEKRDKLIAQYITGEIDKPSFLDQQEQIRKEYEPVSRYLTEIIKGLSDGN